MADMTTIIRILATLYYLVVVPIMTNVGPYADPCQTFDGVNNWLHAFGVSPDLALMVVRFLAALFGVCR